MGCGRKWSWPNLKYDAIIYLEWVMKNHKNHESGQLVRGPRFEPRISQIQHKNAARLTPIHLISDVHILQYCPRNSDSEYFYRCTTHFEDSLSITHQ